MQFRLLSLNYLGVTRFSNVNAKYKDIYFWI